MIDITTPPFRAGDLAFTRSSPGGYASGAAIPTDPQFSGNDAAYAVPALGGDFQPGSGTPAPTTSPIAKGSPADGGAALIANAPRIDVPVPPTPPAPVALSGTINGPWVVFGGVAAAGNVTVTYDNAGAPYNVITPVVAGDTAGMVAAKVTSRLNESGNVVATQTSNALQVRYPNGSPATGLAVVVA